MNPAEIIMSTEIYDEGNTHMVVDSVGWPYGDDPDAWPIGVGIRTKDGRVLFWQGGIHNYWEEAPDPTPQPDNWNTFA